MCGGFIFIMEKTCYKCHRVLPIDKFNKDRSRTGGYEYGCKDCKKSRSLSYREENVDKIKQYEESRKESKNSYNRNYQRDNKEKLNEYKKSKRKENPLKFREKYKNRFYTDPQFRLSQNIRTRIRKALERGTKSGKSLELLGCSIPELKSYLEDRFLPTMTWDNYGTLWHIDHIIPCASYNLVDPEQQKKCFHYKNLQPLFAKTTIIEGVTYIGNLEKSDSVLQ